MLTHTYVDNSNVFIEGQRASAVAKGLAIDIEDAINRRIFDFSFQMDYGKLHQLVCGDKKEIGSAKLWGSPPPGDTFWKMVESKGFKVKTYTKSFGKEKKVDVAIAYEIAKDAPSIDKSTAEICLVAGDKDFVPVVQDLVEQGYTVGIFFWEHAADELKSVASYFFSLTPYIDHLRFEPK